MSFPRGDIIEDSSYCSGAQEEQEDLDNSVREADAEGSIRTDNEGSKSRRGKRGKHTIQYCIHCA